MKANPANNDTLEEPPMTLPRRRLLAATAATALAAPWIGGTARAEAKQLKISHQFPGGTIDSGDFRDQLCRRFAAELAKRTNGALDGRSLSQLLAGQDGGAVFGDPPRRARHDALSAELRRRRGRASTISASCPASSARYDQGYAWKKAEIGKRLTALMAEKGAVLVTWLWQAGGSASRDASPSWCPMT